jgi:hypothetical protein
MSHGTQGSTISYNLISYADMSILVLTVFKAAKDHLDSFLANYSFPKDFEPLINDIAFAKCEEPLISARLWRSLSESNKMDVRLSLRNPEFRSGMKTPRVVRLKPGDMATQLTPEMLMRLSPQIGR